MISITHACLLNIAWLFTLGIQETFWGWCWEQCSLSAFGQQWRFMDSSRNGLLSVVGCMFCTVVQGKHCQTTRTRAKWQSTILDESLEQRLACCEHTRLACFLPFHHHSINALNNVRISMLPPSSPRAASARSQTTTTFTWLIGEWWMHACRLDSIAPNDFGGGTFTKLGVVMCVHDVDPFRATSWNVGFSDSILFARLAECFISVHHKSSSKIWLDCWFGRRNESGRYKCVRCCSTSGNHLTSGISRIETVFCFGSVSFSQSPSSPPPRPSWTMVDDIALTQLVDYSQCDRLIRLSARGWWSQHGYTVSITRPAINNHHQSIYSANQATNTPVRQKWLIQWSVWLDSQPPTVLQWWTAVAWTAVPLLLT